ncbi:hypothetical protein K502DRAFT_352831 [Neoconidiobolus thromboides FSU 785]|nr:hypothetical protein K502DRAFT_352831 [Neoconidiobolus thromboides FSU 785]
MQIIFLKVALYTCMAIHNTKGIKNEVERYQKFIEFLLKRTTYSISSQNFFLVQLFCTIYAKDVKYKGFIQKFGIFSGYIAEEVTQLDKAKAPKDLLSKWKEGSRNKIEETEKEDTTKYKELSIEEFERMKNIKLQNNINDNGLDDYLTYEYATNNIKLSDNRIKKRAQRTVNLVLNKLKQLGVNPKVIGSDKLIKETRSISNNNTINTNNLMKKQGLDKSIFFRIEII